MGSIRLTRFVAVGACSRMERLPASVYGDENADGYERLPPQLQSTEVNLLYVTDREPEHDDEGNLRYGVGRSHSMATWLVRLSVFPVLQNRPFLA